MRFKVFLEAGPDFGFGGANAGAPMPGMDPGGLSSPASLPPGGGPPGMPPMGGGGGMGMGGAPPPMGGAMGGAPPTGLQPQIPLEIKDTDVWSVLEKILSGQQETPSAKPKNMVQTPSQNYLMS
jgi:hypothetical protein